MNDIQRNAIPGVRCGKCLGRIVDDDNEHSREMQARLYPGRAWVPPKVCAACVVETILSWRPDGEDENDDSGESR